MVSETGPSAPYWRDEHVAQQGRSRGRDGRDGDGRHLELSRAIHQATDFTRPVEEAVVCMKMKMDEVFGWHPTSIVTEMVWLWHTHAGSPHRSDILHGSAQHGPIS